MASPFLFEPAAFRQAGDQSIEYRSHRLCHPQGIGRKACARSRELCHFPQTAGELCRRELVAGRHGALKLGSASRGDHLLERILRRVSQAIQWYRLLRRRARSGQAFAPTRDGREHSGFPPARQIAAPRRR